MNSPLGTATKILTLLPFVVLVYFFDFQAVTNALASPEISTIFEMSVTFFVLWVVIKWRVLAESLEVSRTSFAWGSMLIAASVLSYLYGSYTSQAAWFHYESLLFFITGYIALRIGTRILRALAPALMVLGIGYLPLSLLPALEQNIIVLEIGVVFLIPFLALIEQRRGTLAIAVSVMCLGLFSWLWPLVHVGGLTLQTLVLIPTPLLALAVPSVWRSVIPGDRDSYLCEVHRLDGSGFCTVCGQKSTRQAGADKFEGWGLLAIGIVSALLIFSTVPVVTVRGDTASYSAYTARGLMSSIAPGTPDGWQVNSSAAYIASSSDLYAVKLVYVPIVHPESKNYTEYFVISSDSVVEAAPEGDIPGWGRSANEYLPLGQLSGYLTTYSRAGAVMMVYQGESSATVLTGSGFQRVFITAGYVRVFKNSNATADDPAFLADVTGTWIPTLSTGFFDSSWGVFMSSTLAALSFMMSFVELTLSLTIIGGVAYEVMLHDRRLDRFITTSSLLETAKVATLNSILQRSAHCATEHELITSPKSPDAMTPETVRKSLDDLASKKLVRRGIQEREGRLTGVWKAPGEGWL